MIIRMNKRKCKYLLMVIFALVLGFMFHLDRSMNMDFNRWQEIMETIRHSEMSLLEFLEDKTYMLKWSNVTLPYMYSFDVLLYLVSRFFSNNYVLVWVSVLIDYTIIAHIAYDLRKDSKYSQTEVLLSILICFAFLPVIHVCSNLRTATSACFMALAVYKFLYRDKGLLFFLFFSGISITFHPFAAFAIPIALVIKLTTRKIVFYITVLGCLFISRIADLFSRSGIAFLRLLAKKYVTYSSEGQYRAYRFTMYGTIVFAVLVIAYYLTHMVNKKAASKNVNQRDALLSILTGSGHDDSNQEKVFLFFSSYLALLIGNVGSYELVCRGGYLIGASAPIFTDLLLGAESNTNKNVALLIRLAIVVLLLYVCFSWVRYYYPYFI